ncbi:sporulation protein YqfC [Syntrophomonas erecta]
MDKRREVISKAMAEFLEIPKDLVMDLPKLTIIGRDEIYVENHKGIIEYSTTRIRINLVRGFLEIEGRDLTIKTLVPDEMSIWGTVTGVKYHD